MEKSELNILVVEDNPGDFRLVSEMLKECIGCSFKAANAARLQSALEILGKERFDVVLLDLDLPDSRGLETLGKLIDYDMSMPVIVLTGRDDERLGMQAIEKHACDYLIKGQINTNLLVRSIRYAIERKKSEDILRRDKETFEKLVKERTQELLDAQLKLERNKHLSDMGALAATVAHELRNPLAAITMAAYNIRKKAPDAPIGSHLNNIEKKVAESSQIINNLLSYSRIRPPSYENIDINEIIEECAGMLQNRPQDKKGISIKKEVSATKDIIIEGDPLQMKEVLCNIFNNSYDAVSESGGEVEIFTDNDGDSVRIRIKDNGAGIDKEHLEKVFDPFFSTKPKGTGLGLSVCKHIIDLHNGTIGIESEPGRGTSVLINLPKKEK